MVATPDGWRDRLAKARLELDREDLTSTGRVIAAVTSLTDADNVTISRVWAEGEAFRTTVLDSSIHYQQHPLFLVARPSLRRIWVEAVTTGEVSGCFDSLPYVPCVEHDGRGTPDLIPWVTVYVPLVDHGRTAALVCAEGRRERFALGEMHWQLLAEAAKVWTDQLLTDRLLPE